MPKVESDEKIKQWVQDWQESFSTLYDEEALSGCIGHSVRFSRTGDEEVYEVMTIVGYSKTVLVADDERAVQWSVLTADGKMIQLRAGVKIELAD